MSNIAIRQPELIARPVKEIQPIAVNYVTNNYAFNFSGGYSKPANRSVVPIEPKQKSGRYIFTVLAIAFINMVGTYIVFRKFVSVFRLGGF